MRLRGTMSNAGVKYNNMTLGRDNATAFIHGQINARGMEILGNAEGSNAGPAGHKLTSTFDGSKPPIVKGRATNHSQMTTVLDRNGTGNTIFAVRSDGTVIQHVDLSTA